MSTEIIRFLLIALSCVALAYYRWFIYRFYRCYPRDRHFYQVKSYTKSSHYAGLLFWWGLYAFVWIVADIREKAWSNSMGACLAFVNIFALLSSLDFKLHLMPLRLLVLLAGMTLLVRYPTEVVFSEQLLMISILCLLYLAGHRSIGSADIYLLGIFSFLLPVEKWLWLILTAAGLGLCYALMLRLLRIGSSAAIAFGPWLCLSAWLILLLA